MINDSNEHLINVYRMVRDNPQKLIDLLSRFESFYRELAGYAERKEYFMEQRIKYNEGNLFALERASLFLFLMHTCYNGVYSVNRKGQLSMSFGNGQRTNIVDPERL